MRRRLRFGRWCFPLLLAGLFTTGPFTSGAQEVDAVPAASARLIFHRSTAGLSKSNSSPSNPSVRLERMLLLLKPSPARQQKLEQLLEAQQTRGNPSYHQFLTPTQFASRFAPTAADVANVVAWLRDQGFTVAALPASRGWIEFSGTVAQVQQAFGAQVKAIATEDGQMRYRFDSPAKFPAAISGSVNGLVSLDGSLSAPAASAPAELSGSAETLAALTSLSHAPALTPALAANWLHLTSLQADGLTGKGESIAIPARSNVREEDFAAFRKTFGLPESTLDVRLAGLDPGRTADEAAAMQAVSWAGAVAPDAQIILVPAASTNATDGVDLALAALIDGALAHTVSVSYSACEGGMNPAHLAFYGALYAQAAAEGIVIVAATGDSGAAACHSPLDTRPVQSGLAVNALASTPWNTALGAAAFIAGSAGSFELTAWQPSSAAEPAYATGGGFSSAYATPAWQSAAGLPDINPSSGTVLAHPRYLPDLSLPAAFQSSANAIRGLAFCLSEDSNRDGCRLVSAGGSEAATAVFSGIAAIRTTRQSGAESLRAQPV